MESRRREASLLYFLQDCGSVRLVHYDMVLESAPAHESYQIIQTRDFRYGARAESPQAVISQRTLAHVSSNVSLDVVRTQSSKGKRSGRCSALHRPVRILGADDRAQNRSGGDLGFWNETLRLISAMEEDDLILFVAVVVVPIHQRTGLTRS